MMTALWNRGKVPRIASGASRAVESGDRFLFRIIDFEDGDQLGNLQDISQPLS
jgi:hypothetical protein